MYFGRKRKYAAKLRAQERKKPSRIISLLLVISMLCGNFVGMSTGAAEMVAYCGMEEHTHSEACYCAVQAEGEAAAETLAAAVPTEETAAETTEESTAPTEGAALSVSGGSDAQALIGEYVEKELCCGMEEHKHDIACYSNPLADLETAAIWEATLPEKLSGDWGKDLAEVAKSQLGYAESAANYLVGADGETLMGYSRYGAWYSSYTQDEKQAYADWNVPFLFFCLYYAGVTDFPIEEDCADWTAALAAAELWREAAGEYIPEAGDLVFLDTDDDGAADRAAVVTDWDEAKVTAVESDSEGAVKTVTYDLTEDTQVLGYGDTNEAQAQIEVSGGEDAPELFGTNTPIIYFAAPVAWTNAGYTIKVFVRCGENGDGYNTTHLLQMNDTGKLDSSGRKLYSYSFQSGECPYGGFYQLYFQAFNGNNWACEYKAIENSWTDSNNINGKQWTPGESITSGTNFNGSWETYSPVDDPNPGEESDTLPAVPSGKRRVFYDATLSKLSYAGDAGEYEIPKRGSSTVYCYADKLYTMTKLSSYTVNGRTWKNVYYVDISANCTQIAFANFQMTSIDNHGWSGESTKTQTIPSEFRQPCFYADSSDSTIYNSYDGNRRGGYWGEVFSIRDAQAGKNTDVVDISSGTLNKRNDVLYVNTTLYDYFTDYELNGTNRDNYATDGVSWTSHRIYQPFRHFNIALSEYYRANTAAHALYWGNFQNYSGAHFTEISDTMNLYSFNRDGNTSAYKKFFYENNSMWGSNGADVGNSGKQATQGLVSGTLSNGALQIDTKNNGTFAAPFFNESFLSGTNALNTKLGEVYHDVSFPFIKKDLTSKSKDKNGNTTTGKVGYWYFDSSNTSADNKNLRLYKNENGGYYLASSNQVNATTTGGSTNQPGYFPFNTSSQSGQATRLNYGFGQKFEIDFRLTEDGTVTTTANEIVPVEFNFSGDDDVWVFIDGHLVLDVGGGHGVVDGIIDFYRMTATVSRAKNTSNGTSTNVSKDFPSTLKNDSDFYKREHTLTMFYMERGLWESNMMITFNFPDENLLEVEKVVDDGAVNDLFDGMFSNRDLFTFNIKTLATHFGTQEVNLGDAVQNPVINVPVQNGNEITLSSYTGISFSNWAEHSAVGSNNEVIRWRSNIDDTSKAYRSQRYGQIALDSAKSLSGYRYLDFKFWYNWSDNPNLSNMFIDLRNESGVSLMKSSYMSVSQCITGSPSMAHDQWISVRLDLSKMLNTYGNVKYIRIGYDLGRNVYIKDISFQPSLVVNNSVVGFVTPQNAIPDYGSAASGELEVPVNAVYTSSNGNSYRIGADGQFTLRDGEAIVFHDQFRRGSYMYLKEEYSYLYSTNWTMYEGMNESIVTSNSTSGSNTVSGGGVQMYGHPGSVVVDGRIEIADPVVGENDTSVNKYQTNNQNVAPEDTFVFRHYTDPDSTSVTTKLKIKFTNTINVGTLKFSKAQASSSEDFEDTDTFTFYVEFFNVGGMHLEDSTIIAGPYELAIGQSESIGGIPVGTHYRIHEVKPSGENFVVEKVNGTTIPELGTLNVNGTSYTTYSVEGSIPTYSGSSMEYGFNNSKKTVVNLTVRKNWDTGTETVELPVSINVQLQRTTAPVTDTSVWTKVSGYENVTLAPGYTAWKDYSFTFKDLDRYTNKNNTTSYSYRVVELDANGNPVADGGVIGDFVVTYGSVTGNQTSGYTQTITNTLDSKTSLTLTKNWTFANGETLLNDSDLLPASITVQLQRKAKNVDDATWAGVGEPVTITATSDTDTETPYSWTYTFSDLDKTGTYNNEPVEWEYQVIELKVGDEVVTDGAADDFTVIYGAVTTKEDDASFEQTITNAYDPKIDISVNKVWPGINSNDLSAVMVRLERKLISGSWDNSIDVYTVDTAELTEEAAWSHTFEDLPVYNTSGVQFEYRVVELDNQTAVANDGYIVHDGRLFKVSYSDFTTDTNSNKSMTITNTAQTVKLDITKQSSVAENGVKPTLDGAVFKLEKMTDSSYARVESVIATDVITQNGGKASFTGLSQGYYLLTETQAAAGYSLLASPIKIEITANVDGTFMIKVDNGTEQTVHADSNGTYAYGLTVYNKPQLVMPPTGGVGGFEFWILGGLLIMAVPLLMYTFIWYRKGGKYLQR